MAAHGVLGLIAGAAAYGGLWLASSPFFTAGGSDALMISLEPPFWAQVMACFIVGIAIVLLPFARASVAIVLLTVALLAFLSAAHRITVDGRHAVLRDAYLFVPVTRARFDPVEGLAADYHYEAGDWIVTLKPRDGRQTAHLFLGVPPWRIDATPLSVFWPRTQSPG